MSRQNQDQLYDISNRFQSAIKLVYTQLEAKSNQIAVRQGLDSV